MHFVTDSSIIHAMEQARAVVDLPATLLCSSVPEEPVSVDVTFFREGEARAWAPVRVERDWKTRAKEEEEGYLGTALDPRLGKEPGGHHRSARCALCDGTWRRCSGHFGVRENAWLLNPVTAALLSRIVGCLAPDPTEYRGSNESGLLLAFSPSREARDALLEAVRSLPPEKRISAAKIHAKVQLRGRGEDRRPSGVLWSVDFRRGCATARVEGKGDRHFTPKTLYDLLCSLTPFDLETLGVASVLGLVFKDLPILPTPARPTALRDGCTVPHAHTHAYNRICSHLRKADDGAPPPRARRAGATHLPESHAAQASRNLCDLLWPLALGKKKKATQQPSFEVVSRAIGDALHGKEGDIRGAILGKRAFDTMRSNIIPDSALKHNQARQRKSVGVPASLARLIDVAEPCNAWSRATTLVGLKNTRFMNELRHTIVREHGPENTADGLIALRPMRAGDIVALNRQPTLSNTSIVAVETVIVPGIAIRVPPDLAPKYHADYDGDEMNIVVPGSYETMTEMRMLMTSEVGHLSDATAQPCDALHQDAVLGTHLLTAEGLVLSRHEVLRLTSCCGKTRIPQSTASQAGLWRGRDVVEVALEHLPPDFYYRSDTAEVRGGKLVSGPLKKKHTGAAAGGLVHCISRTCGGAAALEFLDVISRLAHEFLLMRPPCMTGNDLRLGEGTPVATVDAHTLKLFSKARSVSEACEISEAMVERAHSARVTAPMRAGARNAFTLLVSEVACKGSSANLCQQYGAVGQQTVVGRPPPKNGTNRTLPIFGPRSARTPAAMGFVAESLVDGLNVAGNYFHTWSSRSGLVDGRLNTPKSGYHQRSLIAPMKNCVTSHDGTVRCDGGIVQFCYGGDGSSPRACVLLDVPREELRRALAEAENERDGELALAAQALMELGPNISLPVPLRWLMGQPERRAVDPRDRQLVVDAALSLRPFEPSRTTRAALLVLFRRSERERYGLTGPRLRSVLDAVKREWISSRVPAGLAVGVLVGTSIGPPATQSSLDAFHVAGMHKTGASATTSATAFRTLLNASKKPDGVGMVIHLRDGSEIAARKLSQALPKMTVESLVPRGPGLVLADRHARAQKLLRAREAAYGTAPPAQNCVVVPLASRKVPDPLQLAFAFKDALRLEAIAWPFRKAPFLVVVTKSPKAAQTLLKTLPSKIISGVPNISEAYPVKAVDGSWTVETQGSNLAAVFAMREVDCARTYSRCTRDTCEVLGVEAAVACAYREIKRLIGMSNVNHRHMSLFADFMMRAGVPLPFTRHGMKAGGAGPLQRALFECPAEYLSEAALTETEDKLDALTAQIFMGKKIRAGTGYSKVGVDLNALQ